MALCLKLLLLTVYFLLLFLLGRLLELIAWYEGGLITYRFLDPMTLSVLKLKSVLENRGISYSSIVEKNELSSLVEVTGKPIYVKLYVGDLRVITCHHLIIYHRFSDYQDLSGNIHVYINVH